MKAFARYLWILSALAAFLGVTYYVFTKEVTGTVLFLALALMPLIFAIYLGRHDITVSDDADTEPSEHAGQRVGDFPSTTMWPIVMVIGFVLTGGALVYGLILLPLGLGVVGLGVIGLMKESRS